MTANKTSWINALKLHESAITQFLEAALKVPEEEWAKAENEQWAPAHVTEHLTLIYDVLLQELQGGAGMKVRTNFLTQRLLRWFIVPKMLRGGPFPRARAPRETRPVITHAKDQTAAVQALRELAVRFQETIVDSFENNPKMQLTHAYFGSGSLDATLLLCARHIQHHARGLGRSIPQH